MKTYTFPYQCDEYFDSIEMEISEEEAELIKEAHRNAFTYLAEDSDLDELNARALDILGFYDEDADQDIRVYFPEELVDEANREDDE